jgi:hypothetical protein
MNQIHPESKKKVGEKMSQKSTLLKQALYTPAASHEYVSAANGLPNLQKGRANDAG